MRGALFENFVVSELLKRRLFAGKSDELYFWRDSNGVEIDVIEEDNLEIKAYEIKASETMNTALLTLAPFSATELRSAKRKSKKLPA